ncbi:MAG: kelch repeat-containing protein, partial [Rhizobacter sp.]
MSHGKCLVLLPLLAATAAAQLPTVTLTNRTAPRATWVAITTAGTTLPAGTPPAVPNFNTTFRADSCGAASNDKLWVFGGSLGNNTSTVTNDLWAFDALAGTFTQIQAHGTAGAPPARGRHAVAWNPTSNKLVVFGGNTRGTTPTLLNDTWEYDPVTNTWLNVTPVTSPTPRQFTALAFDPVLGGMLLFGGQTNDVAPNTNSNETWLFLGGAWSQLSPANSPAPRGQQSMMTRSDFGDVILCGGIDNGIATPEQIRFLDVWTWNGSNWTKISDCDVLTNPTGIGATWPGSVNGNQAVYDPLRKRVVMQGGNGITVATNTVYVYGPNFGGSPSNYTNEFDCLTNQWVLCSTGTGTTPFNNSDPQIGRISRYFGGFVASTGKVYKVCGQNAAGSSSKPIYNVYSYQANPIAT